jgi:hypothetical protein
MSFFLVVHHAETINREAHAWMRTIKARNVALRASCSAGAML